MKRIIDKKELRVSWQLDHWYEKWLFVFGVGYGFLYAVAFIIGFIGGIIS